MGGKSESGRLDILYGKKKEEESRYGNLGNILNERLKSNRGLNQKGPAEGKKAVRWETRKKAESGWRSAYLDNVAPCKRSPGSINAADANISGEQTGSRS